MADLSFEDRLGGDLRAYAEGGVRPIDRYAIALDAIGVGQPRGGSVFGGSMSSRRLALAGIAAILAVSLVLVALVAAWRRSPAPTHLAANGAIAFGIGDIHDWPYNHVHLTLADGSHERAIAQGSCPRWSADGRTMTWFSGWQAAGNAEIQVAEADGAHPRSLGPYLQHGYEVAPDGSRLVVLDNEAHRHEAPLDLWLVDIADGARRLVVAAPTDPLLMYTDPVWAPDGRSIAFAVMRDNFQGGYYRSSIDVVDVASGNRRTLTSRPGSDFVDFSWSPDGSLLAYGGLPDGTPFPSIGPDGGPPTPFDPEQDIFVIRADGSGDRDMTRTSGNEYGPLWSPDATRIAYLGFDGSGGRLIVRDADGVHSPVERSIDPDFSAVTWSPDATKLLLTSVRVTSETDSGQTLESTIASLDSKLTGPPTTLIRVPFGVNCASWQPLFE